MLDKPITTNATHASAMRIGKDRCVIVERKEDGSFSIEWQKPRDGAGFIAEISRVNISHEAACATCLCLGEIMNKLEEEQNQQDQEEKE